MRGKTTKPEDYKKILIKKAIGYDTTEVIEEYVSSEDGEVKLTKKKVTKKNVPPDLSALKMLLESENVTLADMTDEELLAEKTRLLSELKKLNEEK